MTLRILTLRILTLRILFLTGLLISLMATLVASTPATDAMPIAETMPEANMPEIEPESSATKITFDLSSLSDAGLAGSRGSVRSLSYEFCIPATEQARLEVQAIDPSVHTFTHSKGRIGCRGDQFLCIGSTHQPRWRSVLQRLTQLDYIERIDEFFGE